MGQPNAKESKRKAARSSTGMLSHGSASAMTGLGLIASTVRNIVLQSGHVVGAETAYSRYAETTNAPGANRSLPRGYGHPSTRPVSHPNLTLPVVLRYLDQDVQALLARRAHVCVAVAAMDWRPLLMTPSTDSFYALLELPPGRHHYRFLVDGREVVDSTQPLAPLAGPAREAARAESDAAPHPLSECRPANTILLDETALNIEDNDGGDPVDDEEGWGQEETLCEESRKYPPIIPLHLRYTPLNSPPTLVRCARNGCLSVVDASAEGSAGGVRPEHLPLPLSVTINHVYFQRREDHAVMGVTTRHSDKFTTVVYYTPLPVE
ncbi:unnamed protein product [Phytomonas sp. EM1]|nr:unnamed protein product [Phytomonas sp. EM1]|eukprot:CCW63756.1 unnamed protein product [Phytomonas sp. isolate EM1]